MDNIKPAVELQWVEMDDPTFNAGETHTATLQVSNTAAAPFTYIFEMYLDVMKVATSGKTAGTLIPANGTASIPLALTMPITSGTWHVYIDVTVGTTVVNHLIATQDVTVVVQPGIGIIGITWS